MFAGLVFVLLPVHAESVAWITGRVDSMPALFYLAAFLAYVRYRRQRLATRCLHLVARAVLRRALHQAEHDHDGGDARRLRRHRPGAGRSGRSSHSSDRTCHFALMTAAYLWLRYILFGQVAREGALNARGARGLPHPPRPSLQARRRRRFRRACDRRMARVLRVVVAAMDLDARSRALEGDRSPRRAAALSHLRRRKALLYFGPVWWAIGVLPIAVAGYHSPRHVYLAAVGWAIVACALSLEAAWRRSSQPQLASRASRPPRRSFCCSTSCRCTRAVHEWRDDGCRLAESRARRARRGAGVAARKPGHHRRARTELGVGATVCRRVHRISGPISTIASSSFRRARSVAARRHGSRRHAARFTAWSAGAAPRFGDGVAVGPGQRRALPGQQRRCASAAGPDPIAPRHAATRRTRQHTSAGCSMSCRAESQIVRADGGSRLRAQGSSKIFE